MHRGGGLWRCLPPLPAAQPPAEWAAPLAAGCGLLSLWSLWLQPAASSQQPAACSPRLQLHRPQPCSLQPSLARGVQTPVLPPLTCTALIPSFWSAIIISVQVGRQRVTLQMLA